MTEPAARVAAPASHRRGPASTAEGQRSRDRILKAAEDLITESGIDKVRLAEIAARVGMSTGQVMYYFTSKEHILLETLAWREEQETSRRRAAVARATGAWAQLERLVSLYLPASSADPSWILWLEAWARAPHNADVSRFLEDLLQPYREDLIAIVTDGVQDGTFGPPADLDNFVLRYIALLDGLAIRHWQMPRLTRKKVIEIAMTAARTELARSER